MLFHKLYTNQKFRSAIERIGLTMFMVLSIYAPLSAQAITQTEIRDLAKRSFSSAVAEYDIPGLVVGVTVHGQHYFFATGLASREDNIAVSADTMFELGSISKIFNVSLAALAEQWDVLDLDAAVSDQIPELQDSAFGELRLTDLATHSTGGLPLQVPDSVRDVPGLLDWLAAWQPPQQGFRSYSNISIGLLGYITASALGKSFSDSVQQELFPAMGLESTWIVVPPDAMNRYAFGYDRRTNAPIRVGPGVLDYETYGVKSTARDMLRLLDLEMGQAETTLELRTALERTRQGYSKTAFYVQGMIWEQYPWPVTVERIVNGNGYDFIRNPQLAEPINPPLPAQKDVILNKTGSTNGFGSYIVMLPGKSLGVVVLANRNYPNEARVRTTFNFVQGLLQDRE